MGKVRSSQSGFSAVETILVLVVVFVIGAVGFMVYKSHDKIIIALQLLQPLIIGNKDREVYSRPLCWLEHLYGYT